MKQLPRTMVFSKYTKPGMKGYIEVLQERQRALAVRKQVFDRHPPGQIKDNCQELYDAVESDIVVLNQMRADGFLADQALCNCADSDGGEWYVDWTSYWADKKQHLQDKAYNIDAYLTKTLVSIQRKKLSQSKTS
jgi:hypothetical protein